MYTYIVRIDRMFVFLFRFIFVRIKDKNSEVFLRAETKTGIIRYLIKNRGIF